MTALLPCPWCQKMPDVYDGAIVGDTGEIAECATRGCPNMHHPMRVEEWNRRAPVRVDDAMVKLAFRTYARCELDGFESMRAALEGLNKESK